jgi:NarL family two-component system response regulator LiaR
MPASPKQVIVRSSGRHSLEPRRNRIALNQPSAVVYAPQPLWLGAVVGVLEGANVEITGRASTRDDCVSLVVQNQPALLVSDASDESYAADLELVQRCLIAAPQLRVILLASRKDIESVDAALKVGVSAYVFKTAHAQDVAAAVRQAFDHSVHTAAHPEMSRATAAAPRETLSTGDLTQREAEVLALVAKGHSNAKIAKLLTVTEQTVKFHLSNVYRKLGVGNRTQASHWAHERGLVSARVKDAGHQG